VGIGTKIIAEKLRPEIVDASEAVVEFLATNIHGELSMLERSH
jgi:hypothetical protein